MRPPPDSQATRVLGAVASDSTDVAGRLREQGALADLAFGSMEWPDPGNRGSHLAFASTDELIVDLDDPAQRDMGDYTLIELLGRGGMGVVYRAHQASLDREVALKLLAAGPWASADFIERFKREAQSAARMQHPNIVAIHEFGQHGGLNFFSMRVVHGPSLAQRLEREGPFPPCEAATLLRTVAEAVDYAHRLSVLHLDLKPGNVLIDETGQPLVADFGLARRLDQILPDAGEDVSGTPSYMAPEQAQAGSIAIGRATDIYGLGAILYELLTGRPPFLGATPQTTLQMVVRETLTPPRQIDPKIPRDLEAICLHCLARDPVRRYASAGALAADLGRFLDDRALSIRMPGARERAQRWIRREPRFAAAVAAAGLVLAVGLISTGQQWQRAEGNAAQARSLLWEGRREAALRLEQDGRGFEAQSRLIDNLRDQEAAGVDDAAAMDRLRIGLMQGQGARLIDRLLIPDASPMAVEVSPDGTVVAVAFNDLSVRWYDSSRLRELGRVDLGARRSSDGEQRSPQLLRFAGNQRLRVTLEWYRNGVSPNDGDTWLVDLQHAVVIEPPPAFAELADATYSADGRLALLRNQLRQVQLWQVEPWKPLSALSAGQPYFSSWLLDPQGRFALNLVDTTRRLLMHDLPDLGRPQTIALPANTTVLAWTLSDDGRQLALGDSEGRVYLLDTTTRVLRALPSGRGREVLWLGFSDDGAWLASANYDGTAQAFDVASGDALVTGRMQHTFPVHRVVLDREQRLLVASGAGQTALWRLPRQGARALPPHRIGLAPAAHGLAARYPIGWSPATGLLASAGMDGQLRLWRLPRSPTAAARSAHQVPESAQHTGRLVDVAWNQLRLVSPDGRRNGPWLTLPQPPGFAELADQDRLLLVTVGAELRVYDAGSLRLRHPPVPLPNTPQRLLASADARRVVLDFGAHGAGGLEDRLRMYDAQAGRWLSGEATLRGPLTRLSWSPDEGRLLAVGPADGATTLLEAADLAVVGEYAHDPFEPIVWATFDGAHIAMVTRADDRRLGSDSFLLWDPATDRILQRHDTGLAQPRGVHATAHGRFVFGAQLDQMFDAGGVVQPIQRLAFSDPSALSAQSRDGRLLARAFRHEVQLYDARTAEAVGPPLVGDSHPTDFVATLGFSPAGDAVFARTLQGRWLHWSLIPESETVGGLETGLERVGQGRSGGATLHPPTTPQRTALRAADPGAWPIPAARPAMALAPGAAAALAIPARAPGTPARLLDLSTIYDLGPESINSTYRAFRPPVRVYPMGLQRMAGVDFDIRGVAYIGHPGMEALDGWFLARPLACLPLPAGPVAALHLLTSVTHATPMPTGTVFATLTLHYADGGTARLPLRAGAELPGHAGDDRAVPISFAPETVMGMSGYGVDGLATPRLVLPEPGRALRCLDLQTERPTVVLDLLAITLELPEASVMDGAEHGNTAKPPRVAAAPDPPRPHGELQ
jgi:WD40 repeat protein